MKWTCDENGNCTSTCEAAAKIEGWVPKKQPVEWYDCTILQQRTCVGEPCLMANITRAVWWALANELEAEASQPVENHFITSNDELEKISNSRVFRALAGLLFGRTGR